MVTAKQLPFIRHHRTCLVFASTSSISTPRLCRSLSASSSKKPEVSKYSKTVNLPKSKFPAVRARWNDSDYEASAERNKRFYESQSNACERSHLPRFHLLDGPPYANGAPHMGHALNRIIKDVIVRHKASTGHRVQFRPGWDCHGLPIELAAEKRLAAVCNVDGRKPAASTQSDAMEIRRRAHEFALDWVDKQRHSFQRWSCAADWPNPYLTLNAEYEARQLELFWRLYEKGLVYRAYKPVYWSPSSKTALAESELEYNDTHTSTAVHFQFIVVNFPFKTVAPELDENRPTVCAVIWTTTPWTLPVNNAICYNPAYTYVVAAPVTRTGAPVNGRVYVVAESAQAELCRALNVAEVKVFGRCTGRQLDGVFYSHPVFLHAALPFYPGEHVTADKGTGLVHCAFAHGFDDFRVAQAHGERVQCMVDDDGRYVRAMRPAYDGKHVLGDGTDAVLASLSKHVLHKETYQHSYPYDWRTKQPVIIRCSMQWFIDTQRITDRALQLFNASVDISDGGRNAMNATVASRPSWCISRQRVWGVPVPVFYPRQQSADAGDDSGDASTAIITAESVHHLAALVRRHGADCWWTMDERQLVPPSVVKDSSLVCRGADVMDVWLDSGCAWHSAASDDDRGATADLVVEGVDQFRGWFQSMLLLAVAADDKVPYKKILYHGFVRDDVGKKMSKSDGNVVSPDELLEMKGVGVDGLRLWAARYGLGDSARVGPSVVISVAVDLKQIRLTCRFVFGSNSDFDAGCNSLPLDKMEILDRYTLHLLSKLVKSVRLTYDNYAFERGVSEVVQFVNGTLSAFYLSTVKDRLYCESADSPGRRSAQTTLDAVVRFLLQIVSPILPDLVAECAPYLPNLDENWRTPPVEWENQEELVKLMEEVVLPIRRQCLNVYGQTDPNGAEHSVTITASSAVCDQLALLQSDECSFNSALTEIVKAPFTRIQQATDTDSTQSTPFAITVEPSPYRLCLRCRRKCCTSDSGDLCTRCADAVSALNESSCS